MKKVNSAQQRIRMLSRLLETQIPREMDLYISNRETYLRGLYADALDEVKKDLAKAYEKYAVAGKLRRDEMMKFKRLISMEDSIAKKMGELGMKVKRGTRTTISTTLQDTYLKTRYAHEATLGVKTGLYGINERLIESNLINPYDRIKWSSRIDDNIKRSMTRIKNAINQGTIQGYRYDKIAGMMNDIVDKNYYESVRIVRTETHRAQNAAHDMAHTHAKAAAERQGIKIVKMWVSAKDDRTRAEHLEMDGVTADDDGIFRGALTAEYPGATGMAEHDINCRCTVVTKVEDIENVPGVGEVPIYSEWVQGQHDKILHG